MARSRSVSPRKQPAQARSKATVAAILTAAAQVFERHGYAAGTTDRIAERAGVSVGSVYQYFPNKSAILVALAEQHMAEGFERVGALLATAFADGPPKPAELLRAFVDGLIELHAREPKLHRVIFEEAPLPAALRTRLEQVEHQLIEQVEQLLAGLDGLAVPDSRAASYLLIHCVEGLVHSFVLHPPEGVDRELFVTETVRLLHRYLFR